MIHGLSAVRDSYESYRNLQKFHRGGEQPHTDKTGTAGEAHPDKASGSTASAEAALTAPEEDPEFVAKLSATDMEVRAHEAAHAAAGGSHITGGVSFTYQTGPDGKRYAIGGEVSIDVSAVPGNPQATITKMMMVRAAALAPANPSPQDLAVAAAAARMEDAARADLAAQIEAMTATPPSNDKTFLYRQVARAYKQV